MCPADNEWDWRRLTAVALREASRYLSDDEARDAAQEAAIRAWRAAHKCSGPPEPWLRTIARNEALRVVSRRREVPLPDDYEPHCTDDTDTPLAWPDVRGAISRLTQSEQQVVFLRYWSDKTDAQIASMLEIPVGTVKIRLHRARNKLARAVC